MQTQIFQFSWFSAYVDCLERNMTLATIENKIKSDEINSLILKVFRKSIRLWVGGVYSDNSKVFMWIPTGRRFSNPEWEGSNPDFYRSNEFCVEVGYKGDWKLNDNSCDTNLGYICQEKY